MPELPPISKDKQWENLRKACESIGFGRMTIIIKDGLPVSGDLAVQNFKFDKRMDDENEFRVQALY
jgi:hypothetical protein